MPEKGEVELEGVNLTLGEVTKLATSPRGRLLLRQLPGCLTALLDMLSGDPAQQLVALQVITLLCRDCDAALELAGLGLHCILTRLVKTSAGPALEATYTAVESAGRGLPPGHAFLAGIRQRLSSNSSI